MAEDSAKKMKLSSYKVCVNAVILMPSNLVPTCFWCWQLMEEVSIAVSHLDILLVVGTALCPSSPTMRSYWLQFLNNV